MDNLTFRRILFVIGIIIIGLGSISLAYGFFTRNNLFQLLGVVAVVIAYLISLYVKRLQKESKAEK